MRTTRLLAAALLAPLTLAACGDDGDQTRTDGGSEPDGGAVDGAPGGGEGGLFIEVRHVGGFLPFGFEFKSLPTAVVYEDGTVVAPGATTLQFPGPAVVPAFSSTIDDETMAALLAAAGEAGLVGGAPDVGDGQNLPVADAATTQVTVVVDGERQVVEAYALDLGLGDLGPNSGLTPAQVEARDRLAEFVTEVQEAVTVAADEAMVASRYRVLASPPVDPSQLDPAGPRPTEAEWPAELPEPADGACTAITEPAGVDALTAALANANELTTWRLGERTFALAVRVVLPHEPDCPPEG